jgi:hypothetical protein
MLSERMLLRPNTGHQILLTPGIARLRYCVFVIHFLLARVMLYEEFKGKYEPMTRGWNGYLVKALNQFASLTVERGAIDAGPQVSIRAKHPRSQSKSSRIPRRRKKITQSDSTV